MGLDQPACVVNGQQRPVSSYLGVSNSYVSSFFSHDLDKQRFSTLH